MLFYIISTRARHQIKLGILATQATRGCSLSRAGGENVQVVNQRIDDFWSPDENRDITRLNLS